MRRKRMEPHTAKATITSGHRDRERRDMSVFIQQVFDGLPYARTVLTMGVSTVRDKCHKAKQGRGERMERSGQVSPRII